MVFYWGTEGKVAMGGGGYQNNRDPMHHAQGHVACACVWRGLVQDALYSRQQEVTMRCCLCSFASILISKCSDGSSRRYGLQDRMSDIS
jgi:hypothetical protein